MTSQFLQKFLLKNHGSIAAFQFNKDMSLDFLNFQTMMMSEAFKAFPEVLLLIRSHNIEKRTLYTFLIDGPCLRTASNTERIVHLAIPKNETPEGLKHMFSLMRNFNSCWNEIRIFLVDPHFRGADAIREVFPSAQVVLSAYHVCRYFQQCIYQLSLPNQTEHLLTDALKITMCSPTRENLKNMHTILTQFIKPTMLMQLKAEWLLEQRIWALHRWRTCRDCYGYLQVLENLGRELNEIFRQQQPMDVVMKALVEYIEEHIMDKDIVQKRQCTSEELAIIACQEKEDGAAVTEPSKDGEAAEMLSKSLEEICNPAAFSLCQKELEVAQSSVQLIQTNEDVVNIQLLESHSEVSYRIPANCTCNFNQCLQLPCRHVLAVITASDDVIKPDMLYKSWQRNPEEAESVLPVAADTLEIILGDGTSSINKEQFVESVNSQLSQMLADCSDEVFERRYSSLRELADAWIGPYEQVKL
ncbi:zinc finger SWIM domain-containing protein 1 [Hyperolius riggenbachi]|uniref:zinc finger SWIM domain-containing protein 1 n=1 Tax=Hyperolius riggenbachi TaxID=752182 RepID=UPI0035A3961B